MISQVLTSSVKNGNKSNNDTAEENDDHILTHTDSDEEDLPLPRDSDYIDVTEQGTITNASRLDRVLKDRERAKKKKQSIHSSTSSRSNSSSSSNTSHPTRNDTKDGDTSYLFNTNLSVKERDLLFKKFEFPTITRNQLACALTALNILLENEQVIGSVVTGKHSSHHMMDMMDDVMMDFDELEGASTVYSRLNPGRHGRLTNMTLYSAENVSLILPESVRQATEHLVYLMIYPALEDWADSCWSQYPLNSLTESRAGELYKDVLQWIYKFSESPKKINSNNKFTKRFHFHKVQSSATTSSSSSSDDDSSDSEDDDQFFSVYSEKKSSKQRGPFDFDETLTNQRSTGYSGSKYYSGFSRRALVLLQSLTRYASVRQYLVQDMQFIKILLYLLEADSKFADRIMTCLGALFAHDPHMMIPEHQFQILAILIWHSILFTNTKPFYFYSRFVLTYCSRSITTKINKTTPPSNMINNSAFVEIDLVSRSKFCFIDYESCLHVRNDSWTFETVRATHAVPATSHLERGMPRKYAYEVILQSGGLMQVGWVTDHFEFDPEGGKGVGDDVHSFGYDGSRAKKWHGKYSNMRTTTYGMIWREGDVVTCAMDLDEGEMRYYLNGTDMGVAFFGIPANRSWYPAVSLATGQQCKLQFGGATDPLKYLPKGYMPIAMLASQSLFTMELPPPRIPKQSSLEETDIADLSKAMEQMSVKSPNPNGDGNVEPNLKPIDSIEPIQDISTRPRQFTFYFMKSNQHEQNSLASIYYETCIGFSRKDALSSDSAMLTFGLQSLDTLIYFEYNKTEKNLTFVIGSDRSEPFEFEIRDGDKVGLLYLSETNAFGITLNGVIQFFIYVGKSTLIEPYFPFVTGSIKSEVNYGEEPFKWAFANHPTSKQHRSNYLYKLIGKISKF